jgi:hypothetical protein
MCAPGLIDQQWNPARMADAGDAETRPPGSTITEPTLSRAAFRFGDREQRGGEHADAEGDDPGGQRIALCLRDDRLRGIPDRAGRVLDLLAGRAKSPTSRNTPSGPLRSR